jgi:hypothetical protein
MNYTYYITKEGYELTTNESTHMFTDYQKLSEIIGRFAHLVLYVAGSDNEYYAAIKERILNRLRAAAATPGGVKPFAFWFDTMGSLNL